MRVSNAKVFHPADLWSKSLSDLDLVNSKGLRLTTFPNHRAQSQQKIALFQLFTFKSLRDQIYPCHKRGQRKPRIIICIKFVVLDSLLLHTMFQSNQLKIFKVFTIYRHNCHLGLWPGPNIYTFFPPLPKAAYEIQLILAQ